MSTATPTGSGTRRRTIRDIALVAFGKYGQYLVTLITLPLTARILGPSGLGLLAVGMSSFFIGSLLGELGITTYVAARGHDPGLDRLRGAYLKLRALILLGALALVLITVALQAPQQTLMITLGLFGGALSSLGDDWVLVGHGRFGLIFLFNGIGRVAYLGLLVALLPRFPDPIVALLCLIASTLVPVGLSWWRTIGSYGPPRRAEPGQLRGLCRLAGPVLSARMLENSYEQGVATVFSHSVPSHALGIFSSSDRVIQAVSSSLDAIGYALLPRLARRGSRDMWSAVKSSLLGVSVLSVGAAVVLAATAQWTVPLIFGDRFAESIPLMRLQAFILPGTAIASFITTAVLPVLSDSRAALKGSIIGTVIILITLAITTWWTGSVWTIVWGVLIAETTVAVWHLVRLPRVRRRHQEEASG